MLVLSSALNPRNNVESLASACHRACQPEMCLLVFCTRTRKTATDFLTTWHSDSKRNIAAMQLRPDHVYIYIQILLLLLLLLLLFNIFHTNPPTSSPSSLQIANILPSWTDFNTLPPTSSPSSLRIANILPSWTDLNTFTHQRYHNKTYITTKTQQP